MEEITEDMPKVETKRRVTAMDTELSKDQLDENDPGYQKPEPKEENTGGHHRYKNKKERRELKDEKKDEERKEGKHTRDRDDKPKHDKDNN